jgi:2-polyprenyl-3-methyl-5-hydroxy-6-metoxy-1,4-benzoquinol methylase
MTRPDWWYDDRIQVGLDFEDEAQVATYDQRQGATSERDAALLVRLGVGPGTVMADIGCGTGLLACEAARLGAAVHAVDASAPMLRAAQARARDQGLTLAAHHASFLTVELGEARFDLITTKYALHHLPDFWKALALRRLWSALKPGGKLYVEDVVFDAPPERLPGVVEDWIAWLSRPGSYTREDGACHVREEHSTFAWILKGLIADAGFVDIVQVEQTAAYGTYLATRP